MFYLVYMTIYFSLYAQAFMNITMGHPSTRHKPGTPHMRCEPTFLFSWELAMALEGRRSVRPRAGVGLANMIPRARDVWLARVILNFYFILIYFSSDAWRVSSFSGNELIWLQQYVNGFNLNARNSQVRLRVFIMLYLIPLCLSHFYYNTRNMLQCCEKCRSWRKS